MDGSAHDPGLPPVPTLSVVLAVLNERPSLPELFARLREVALPGWEAIVVDDGSTDGSREYVASVAHDDPRVHLLLHDGRQTTVTAQCMAIGAARGEYVAVMDADLQHPPELLAPLVRGLEAGAELVVASRYARGGSPGPRPLLRAVISRTAELTAKVGLRPARRLSDPVSGFFAFRRSMFVPLARGQRGYKLLLFLLVMAEGRELREVPFRFEPRSAGASKVTSGLAFVRLFLTEVLLARRLRRDLRRRTEAAAPAPAP
jgi:dolichol-phosphate mannosyltransferase